MELTIKDLKELLTNQESLKSSGDDFYFKSGENVFIRTVTMSLTGRIIQTGRQEIVLEDACWIADTGRFSEFLHTGKINECEHFPIGPVVVGRSAIVDCCLWQHDLPRKTI